MQDKPKIFYLCPDNSRPSWGVGIIYHHVKALCSGGFEAYLVHETAYFKVDWMDTEVPVLYWNQSPIIKESDVLVVPEVMVDLPGLKEINCFKILFVQASSFLFDKLPKNVSHINLGFTKAIAVMPHIIPVIEEFISIKADLVQPFVAEYFYKDEKLLHEREKIILLFPKNQQQDYAIIKRLINDKIGPPKNSFFSIFNKDWKVVELKNRTHKHVAELMKKATFFITTNTFESFNASVVEAMAAGCINLCYEAFGPKDYLVNGKNAFVFPNNEAYALCRQLIYCIDNLSDIEEELKAIRLEGLKIAKYYSYKNMETQLLDYFNNIFFSTKRL